MSSKRHRGAARRPYPLNGLTIVEKLVEFVLMMLAQGVAQLLMAPRTARPDTPAKCACTTAQRAETRVSRPAVAGGQRPPAGQRRRVAPRRRTAIARPAHRAARNV